MTTLISDKKKFIFFHLYKVAGTSITSALLPYSRQASLLDKFLTNLEIILPIDALKNNKHHLSVKEMQGDLIFNDYFKFAFVRNPWDWQVSGYHFMQQGWKVPKHYHVKLKTFEEYIEWRCSKDCHLQFDFLANSKGEIGVDFVGKLENIKDDWDIICKKIDIIADLGHTKKSKHKQYQDYYNSKTKDLIYKAYKKDIEYFEYEF